MIEGLAISLAIAAIIGAYVQTLRLRQSRSRADEDRRKAGKQHADELHKADEERNRLLNALDDAFLLFDSEGRVLFTNAVARDLFGTRAEIARHYSEIIADPRLAKVVRNCIESAEPAQEQVVLAQQTSPRGNRETRGINSWIIDAAPLPGTKDGTLHTRVILRDVTNQHQIEQIRKDFVANASHELRTPMAIINGYLENLLDDDMIKDPETARRFLTVMRKHSERISRIVEDMLMISKLESGEANSLNVEPFLFRSCLQDVTERLESLVQSQQAKIHLDVPDQAVTLHGDRFYWTQILFNLIENALKQNPRPGLEVEVGCRREDDGVRIWVSDNGIGIPSADLTHIFRRFYRVEKHHSQREIKGTGLGLSIVKRAVEAHGGTIKVSSTPGSETRFEMAVPTTPTESTDSGLIAETTEFS